MPTDVTVRKTKKGMSDEAWDVYAAAALNALVAEGKEPEDAADKAAKYADAMLDKRKEREDPPKLNTPLKDML